MQILKLGNVVLFAGLLTLSGCTAFSPVEPATPEAGPVPSQSDLDSKGCEFDGISLPEGVGAKAYEASSVGSMGECIAELRTCSGGKLTGTFAHRRCFKLEDLMVQVPKALFDPSLGDQKFSDVDFGNELSVGKAGVSDERFTTLTFRIRNTTSATISVSNVVFAGDIEFETELQNFKSSFDLAGNAFVELKLVPKPRSAGVKRGTVSLVTAKKTYQLKIRMTGV